MALFHGGRLAALALITAASCAWCVKVAPGQQAPLPPPVDGQQTIQVVAVVNGKQITRVQLAQECVRRFGETVLESMINNFLISQQCQQQGISVTAEDIDQELQLRAKKFGLSVERYMDLIREERQVSPDKLRNEIIWTELALRRLAAGSIQVAQQEVANRVESEFGPKVQVRAIALKTGEEAERVLAIARQNPHEFGRLAMDHSVDTNSAAMKGLLPPIRRNIGDKTFEEAAFGLQVGQISDVVPLEGQFIILKCERHFPGTQLAAEQRALAEQRISEELHEEKLADAAAKLFQQMQDATPVVNVYNDERLRQQMPGVAATVGGHQIPMQRVFEECIARFGQDVLDGEINRTLILQALQKANLSVTDTDLRAEIARAARTFGYLLPNGEPDTEKWIAYVTQNDASKAEIYMQDEVWPSVAMKKLVADKVAVSEDDMHKAYYANFGERVEALAIVLDNMRSAQRVWQMAKANATEKYFGELAHQYSVEPASRANYGEVPPVQQYGGRPQLEEEAFRLKPGEISGLIPIGENWVILWCKGRTTPVVQDFDAVKDGLHEDILEKKLRLAMADAFEKLRQNAQIDNFLAGTSQPGATARGAAQPAAAKKRPRHP